MPSKDQPQGKSKRVVINSAVFSSILGIIITGALGVMGYLQHDRAMLRDEQRANKQWLAEQDKYAKQQDLELTHYMQELQMKLQSQYLAADSLQELVRLEHSLEWLREETPYNPVLVMIDSLRGFIQQDLEAKVEKSSSDAPSPSLVQKQVSETIDKLQTFSVVQQEQIQEQKVQITEKALQDAAIQVADAEAIKQTTKSDRRKLVLTEIVCIDPQSNWPKSCDSIYFLVNGKRIWKDPRKICQGERMRLSENLFFDDETVFELWEYDQTADDHLGRFRFSEGLNRKDGTADIKDADNRGRWHYVIKYRAY